REIERHARPAAEPLKLRNVGDPTLGGAARTAREEPHRAVAALHRIGSDADRRHRMTEEVVRDRGQLARLVVGPAVIHAREATTLDRTERERELAVGTSVLQRAQTPVLTAKERDRAIPELDLHHLSRPNRALVLDRVPAVGIEPRCSDFQTALPRFGEQQGRRTHRGLTAGAGAATGPRVRRRRERTTPGGTGPAH